ncbi:SPFH domain-containing protein [Schleiferilactobacillus harbinensis]|uniref:SPFH/Band 7/PHB domain protein n=1 Tax=Schleiferilactobacillus harbinensis TaxID=304207 RepID=A0A5P8M702_9LACO|nr:SPFH domain-containing protein [Schleiferilactobacillus harbinensis]QFR24249.1 SPFH/Band 7/PHB domain protein [Schleiferilactobacillus harbinensis]
MGGYITLAVVAIIVLLLLYFFFHTFISVESGTEALVTRFGEYTKTLQPGLHFLIPIVNRAYVVSMQLQPLDVEKQPLITKDNATVQAAEKIKYHVTDSYKFQFGNSDSVESMIQDAQSALRSIIGQMDLNAVLGGTETINQRLSEALAETTSAYGLKVDNVAIFGLQPDPQIQQAMNKLLTADREKQAEISKSEGERTAAENRASGQAFAIKTEAEANAYSTKMSADAQAYATARAAEAQAAANTQILDAYSAANLTTEQYVQLQQIAAFARLASSRANTVVMPSDKMDGAVKAATATKIFKTDNSDTTGATSIVNELDQKIQAPKSLEAQEASGNSDFNPNFGDTTANIKANVATGDTEAAGSAPSPSASPSQPTATPGSPEYYRQLNAAARQH